jgi:hypothetical protein
MLNSQNATYVFTKSSCCSITSRVLLRLHMRLCFVGAYLLWVLASQNRFICGASAANMMDELASGCTSSEMLCHEPDFSHILKIRHTVSYITQWHWFSWNDWAASYYKTVPMVQDMQWHSVNYRDYLASNWMGMSVVQLLIYLRYSIIKNKTCEWQSVDGYIKLFHLAVYSSGVSGGAASNNPPPPKFQNVYKGGRNFRFFLSWLS